MSPWILAKIVEFLSVLAISPLVRHGEVRPGADQEREVRESFTFLLNLQFPGVEHGILCRIPQESTRVHYKSEGGENSENVTLLGFLWEGKSKAGQAS